MHDFDKAIKKYGTVTRLNQNVAAKMQANAAADMQQFQQQQQCQQTEILLDELASRIADRLNNNNQHQTALSTEEVQKLVKQELAKEVASSLIQTNIYVEKPDKPHNGFGIDLSGYSAFMHWTVFSILGLALCTLAIALGMAVGERAQQIAPLPHHRGDYVR